MTAAYHDRDRRSGLAGTILVHLLLTLLFLYFGLKEPFPRPEEQMLEVAMADFGTSLTGSGEVETPDPSPDNTQAAPPVSEQSDQQPEEVAVDDRSEVEVKKPDKKPKKPTDKPADKKEPEKPKEPTISKGLSEALNAWNKGGGSGGEGPSDKPGNQGVPDGVPDGIGVYKGDGWSISLGGRGLVNGPAISDKPSEAGKVVLNIFVDAGGKVIRVTQNLDKSTTTSQTLYNIARKAAMQCTFSAKPGGGEQKGEMAFVFILE
ncbi:MAG: hypothetical protein JNM31_11905 [Flavobacteriales bacterium]|nr:hypothetical protein [Flavobacteriales bacterium]